MSKFSDLWYKQIVSSRPEDVFTDPVLEINGEKYTKRDVGPSHNSYVDWNSPLEDAELFHGASRLNFGWGAGNTTWGIDTVRFPIEISTTTATWVRQSEDRDGPPGKKYYVIPGYIKSKNDDDSHYVSYSKLIELYRVKEKDCVKPGPGVGRRGLVVLQPDRTGHYVRPDE